MKDLAIFHNGRVMSRDYISASSLNREAFKKTIYFRFRNNAGIKVCFSGKEHLFDLFYFIKFF